MRRIFVVMIVGLLLIVSWTPLVLAQWSSNPAQNTAISTMTGEQALPKIAVDTNGFSYISWFSTETGNYNVRLQRLDSNGNMMWPTNGILVSNQPQESWITDYDLAVDPSGYALITFTDIRTGQSNPVAYRISPDGAMMWGSNGVLLANDNNFDPSPKICSTTVGNTIVAWQSIPDSGDSLVKLQKISPTGDLLWGSGIVLSETGIDYTAPFLLQTEGDYMYLVWHKETGPYYAPNRGLYVQKLDADGNFMWASDVGIYAPVTSGPVVYLRMCRDDAGGIVFSWYRSISISEFYCFVQHMSADGTVTMPANGVLASTSSARLHMYPAPAFLSQTQEIVLFFSEQDLNQNMRGIYAQKFNLQGNRLWTDEGIQLIGLTNNDYGLFTADGKDNQAICVYQAAVFGTMDAKMQAVMLDDQGEFVWPEHFIDLCTYQSEKLHNVMTNYYSGQWVAVWQDQRNDYGDIFAQNIQQDGSLGVVGNIPPEADFTWAPSEPVPEESVHFDASASSDPDGSIILYEWDWNHDGTYEESSGIPTTTHSWTNSGDYIVTLRVTDNASQTATRAKTVSVVNHAPPTPVISGPSNGGINQEYEFSVGSITDPEGDSYYCQWDWGDGNISDWLGPYASGQIATASHSWSIAGAYELKAKCKDEYDAESNWSEPHELTILNIDFSLEIKGGFGVTVTMKNNGGIALTDIQWKINLSGGLIILGKMKTGSIDALQPSESETFKNIPVLGIGKTTIQVEFTCAEGITGSKSTTGTVFLFFVLGIK
ncbi:MAG: PKD domain-containing protein [Candidatus Thermoplasmatota archaeon]|nr:PKD domain-containing protein [Candidatus Thermoplasmatota archaeon]